MKNHDRFSFLLAAFSSFFVAVLHLAIIGVGPRWYRYFGAPTLAAQIEQGSVLVPTLLTLAIALVFAAWGFYALSAIGMIRRLPLVFWPQPEGGFTVTSPALPELVTEGDTLEEAFANVRDALAAVLELYAEEGRALPPGIELPASGQLVWTDALVEVG